jgi:FAD/FMN-containing dehydrogenase
LTRGRPFENFGRNVVFRAERLTPGDETEVRAMLGARAGRKIRALGSSHSWSGIVRGTDLVIDLQRFDQITVNRGGPDGATVTVGAGCRIAAVLAALAPHGLTLPTVGAITKQTIAGAISTGTHGSGASSLAHYVRALRIATYDPGTREPTVVHLEIDTAETDPLRAARCALGCLGVILSVTLVCVPAYDVEEVLELGESVGDVLAGSAAYPLLQFAVIPYAWRPYVFLRRRADRRRRRGLGSWLAARAYRAHKLVSVDVLLHGLVKMLARLGWGRLTRVFYGHAVPAIVLRGIGVTDASEHALTLRHDLYRHVEMEVFVPAAALVDALKLVQDLTDAFVGVRPLPGPVEAVLAAHAPARLPSSLRGDSRTTTSSPAGGCMRMTPSSR